MGERVAPAPFLVRMDAVPQGANPLADIIRAEIGDSGLIPFARFMALALYHPEFGYYEKDSGKVGRRGDFITSVSVGAVFGQLLAFRFSQWLGAIDGPVRIAEAGAHAGTLAGDILHWLAANDEPLFDRLTYTLIEPSAKRRDWQAKRLAKFAEKVEWRGTLADIPEIHGIIFGNELLDAFPLHRIGWDAAKHDWFEWAVGWCDGVFHWEPLEDVGAAWRTLLPVWPIELLDVLPDQYTTELSLKANAWWHAAADKLAVGKLVAFDYGHGPDDWPAANQPGGTVRGYRDQKLVDDVLTDPGEQDLTAHANFGLLKQAGEAADLRTEQLTSQERFLNGTFAEMLRLAPALGQAIDVRQLQSLTHPAQMGRPFRVLVQAR